MQRDQILKTSFTLATVLTISGMAGCQHSDDSTSVPTGNLTIAVTDSPIDDATAVYISFTGLTLFASDGGKSEINFAEPKVVDLLSLQGNSSQEILSEYAIPTGEYSYATFDIDFDASYMETSTGDFTFQASNLRNAGTILKDILLNDGDAGPSIAPFSVQQDATTHLTFDFDLRKSIFAEDVSNVLSFSPAIRSVVTNESGTIAGTLNASLFDNLVCIDTSSAVYAYSGSNEALKDIRGKSSDPISTANITVSAGRSYEIGFLPAGNYTLAVACNASGDLADEEEAQLLFRGKKSVTVIENSTTNGDLTL
ncbi:MAG: DUF4382 domain-containing protein [Gammaproteobacteria bacterium]|nr:DUF4382 domain-containing protein [Gammaproteobacteria bacterium]